MIIAPQIKKQYFDSNGDPLSGGQLFVYEAGTTTLVTTYTDESGVTPNTNPIILDTRGEVGGLFLDADSYKFVLKDSLDNTVWTEDNITVRDTGTEIDDLSDTVASISDTIASNSDSNRIVSGEKSDNSSKARFLIPLGTSNEVKILAVATNLVFVEEDTEYTVSTDIVGTGLGSPPKTNNTALINDSDLSGENSTKILGEFGTSIPIDTIGSEISSLDGQFAAFKIVGSSTEYFVAQIDNSNLRLTNARRGYFYDNTGEPIKRVTFSDGDTITLMKLSRVYLETDGTMLVSYTEPTYSTTEPASSVDGDMWFNMTTGKWNRFNSTAYIEIDAVFLGTCIQDENDNTVGARSSDFYADFDSRDTFECEYVDSSTIRSKSRFNEINVYGNKLKYSEAKVEWSMDSHLDEEESEGASIEYCFYIKEDGDLAIVSVAPYDQEGDLKGFYHPYESWRYIAKVSNDSDSDFDPETFESLNISQEGYFKLGEDLSIEDLVRVYNDNGPKIKKISGIDTILGENATVFESAVTSYTSCCFDSVNKKVVIAYRDEGNSDYGTAIVGTLENGAISFGTPVVFNSADTCNISCCFDFNNEKIVIAYQDDGNSSYGTAIVGTVSGDSISFGTAVVFASASTYGTSCCFDSVNDRIVIVYANASNLNYGTSIIGTVVDTSISFGVAIVFNSANSMDTRCCFDSGSGKVVVVYFDGGNSNYGTAIVGTVSDTTISFGTEVVFNSASTSEIACCFDPLNSKVVIAYKDYTGSVYPGTAIVGTVSDTTISFGTEVVFNDVSISEIACCFDFITGKVFITYSDTTNSYYGTAVTGTVSGTAISFGDPVVFISNSISHNSLCCDFIGGKMIAVYSDSSSSYYGAVMELDSSGPDKIVGIIQETGSTGEFKKVALLGDVSEAHSSQIPGTKAYIQSDGTLSTIYTDYEIGTFISDKELKIEKNF